MAFKISISNHKGGVGKTTSTLNIGAAMALMGYRVLMIDLDPQANLSQCLQLDEAEFNIYRNFKADDEGFRPYPVKDNLFLVPSSIDFSSIELELSSTMARETVLKRLIASVDSQFDVILLDCPPAVGLILINALVSSDTILIPSQAQYFSLNGLAALHKALQLVQKNFNSNLQIGGVFLTMYDKRKTLNRVINEQAQEAFNDKMFTTAIREYVAIAEAPAMHKDIFEHDPSSPGAEDYAALTKEIINRFNIKSQF